MRDTRHTHACQTCGTETACTGDLERNHDGWPETICRAFHLDGGVINSGFLCEACCDLEHARELKDRLDDEDEVA